MNLDPDQIAVREAVLAGGHHVVLGGPGSGVTTTAVETFAAWSLQNQAEDGVLVVPTRQRAAHLRDQLARRMQTTTGAVLVRTPAALAYAIVRLRARLRGEPSPTLVSGPEQDSILADLMAGHRAGEGAPLQWPDHIDADVQALPAFRAQLRDLLMRAAEAGLDGDGLTHLGREYHRPDWCAAGQLLTEYGDVMALGEMTADRGARYDASSIVDQAVLALAGWADEFGEHSRPSWRLVLHDDYQDATLATARLLGAMASGGAQIVLSGDPDRAVQAFRGGQPALLAAATHRFGSMQGALGAQRHILRRSYRHGPRLRAAVRTLTEQLPVLGGIERREAQEVPDEAVTASPGADPTRADQVRHLLLPTAPSEVAAIARELRVARVRHGVPWSQMAVVVRSAAMVGQVRRGLRTAGIPLAAAVPDRPLRTEPAVRPFLTALQAVVEGVASDEVATELLLSPMGGLDAVTLRTLRRALRGAATIEGSTRSGGEDLLSSAIATPEPEVVAQLPARLRTAVRQIARVLAAGRAAFAADPRNPEMVLWQMWDATSLAQDWQQRALAGGVAADRADADLDAMIALFAAAERFSDRTTGAEPSAFLEHLQTQDFAADSLAARGDDANTVSVHTCASAAGLEWDLVVVAGIQEDSWPDLRIRDTVLGAQYLADIATTRDLRPLPGVDAAEQLRIARAAVRDDELRAFVAACSRARHHLILTAVLDTDARPSAFYELLLNAQELPEVVEVEAALDLRGLVGLLRSQLGGPADRAVPAALVLQHLREQGVVQADPATWADQRVVTSTTPAFNAQSQVPVSPSTVERAIACPLQWLLSTAGGRRPESHQQSLGNLIHDIAADFPHGTAAELEAELDRRWPELGRGTTWVSRTERSQAQAMVQRLAQYLAAHPGQVDVETAFDLNLEGARLRGRIDRLEHTDTGLRVVDLKTGATPPSEEKTQRHAQLGIYQLAVAAGGFGSSRPDGGALVYLGKPSRSVTTRHQDALDADPDPQWASTLVQETVQTLTSATFPARHNDMCGYCQVRTSCPVQPDGSRIENSHEGHQ